MNVRRTPDLIVAKAQFERLRPGKSDLLRLLDESEIPEAVYNSNAIENSTLSLEDTERILLAMEISRHMDLREVHEAQNLARVSDYIRKHHDTTLDVDMILLLHKMLLSNIDDPVSGRFRVEGEYVRVGTHIAPAPEQILSLIHEMLVAYETSQTSGVPKRIARLHLEFERIHPFNDGNGRIGRVLINYLFHREGFPPVIVRNKGKHAYYEALRDYDASNKSKKFESELQRLMLESLHRRIAYLRGVEIVPASSHAKRIGVPTNALLNQARRQNIPAFRERGVWKLPADYQPSIQSS
jgi:Fic family protein